jgi:hypothetical protein
MSCRTYPAGLMDDVLRLQLPLCLNGLTGALLAARELLFGFPLPVPADKMGRRHD